MSLTRKWVGPSREEIGAQFGARHGEWTITLDTEAVHTGKVTLLFTRLLAPRVGL